ncbi:MAG TPA: Npt1/Npt2 family nucleotide transporter, partial [Anaerolineales bacterium]|nr:Npt1/Npt2 family nucleotide transporter [Anaerolineales bacterium]
FVDRIDNNRLFAYIVAAGGIIILAGMVLWGLGFSAIAFPFIYVLSQAWLAIFNPHLFTYINELFDIQSAKRALPVILATGRIGAAVAGFTLKPLVSRFDSLDIIWIWFATDVLVLAAILAVPYFIKKRRSSADMPHVRSAISQGGASSYFVSLKEGWNYTIQSVFLRWMAVGTLLMAVLVTLFEYYGNKIMTPMFESSADYAGFLGQLDGISNLVALLILLFGLSRMTKAWGIGNTSLAFPGLAVLVSGGLAFFPTVLFPAAMSYLTRKGLRFSLQAPIEALLYNAVPVRVKGRIRAFVGGLLTPLGALVGVGFLLFELQYGGRMLWIGGALIALFAIAYLLSAWMIRYYYAQALVKMLEEEDYSFLLTEGASELTAADPATLRRLQKKLEESRSHEMRVFITQMIAQVGGSEALTILIPIVKTAKEARTRAAMLEVITAAGLRGDSLRDLHTGFLSDPDPQVRQAAASGLEQALGSQAQEVRQLWIQMVNDPSLQVSTYALKSLAATGDFYRFKSAVEKLEQLCASESVADKKNAIDVLGVIADLHAIRRLLEYLRDPDDQIRLESILNIEKLSLPLDDPLDDRIIEAAAWLAEDLVVRVRQAALTVAGKYRRHEIYPLLVSALADKSSQVRASAVDLLVEFGKEAVSLAQSGLDSPEPQTYKMSAVVLSRISPRQFTPLIERIVSEDLNSIYQSISFEEALGHHQHHRSVRALISTLRENNHALIDEVLYLLSAVHDPNILKVVGESLHSDSSATRNLALEALESITSPQTAALIASIFEPTMAPLQLLQLGQGSSLSVERLDALQALEQLSAQRREKVRYLLTLHVMGDVGVELAVAGDQSAVARIQPILED